MAEEEVAIRAEQAEQPVSEPQHETQMGYPPDLLEDMDAAQQYLCIMCNKLPRIPLELACGDGACCQQCRNIVRCPAEGDCKGQSDVERMSAAARKKILNLNMKCLRSPIGCEWVGLVKHWDAHVSGDCEYALLDCMDCAVEGEAQVQVRRCEFEQHRVECKRFECALKKNEINCASGGRMNEAEFREHRERAALDHIDAIGESLSQTKLNMQDRINMLQEQNRTLQEEVDKLRQEAEEREEVVRNLTSEMDGLFHTINDMNQRLGCCEFLEGIVAELPRQISRGNGVVMTEELRSTVVTSVLAPAVPVPVHGEREDGGAGAGAAPSADNDDDDGNDNGNGQDDGQGAARGDDRTNCI